MKEYKSKNEALMRNILRIMLALFCLVYPAIATAQPYPPINVYLESRAADNRIVWSHNPNNPGGYIVNYQICRSTTYGATVPIATVTGATVAFNDTTAGYAYDQEFYYTVRSIGSDAAVSPHSEQVMRFLPRVGLTNIPMQNSTVQNLNGVSWDPYPGQWTDTHIRLKTNPNPNSGVLQNTGYAQRQILRANSTQNLPVGGPYYFEVITGAPDWWGSPANNRWVSYSTSLPFYVIPTVYEDNASSTYFNSGINRVMTVPLSTGGVAASMFQGSGGGFWRIRRPITIAGQMNTLVIPVLGNINPARLNAPCRAVITGIPAGEITTTAAAQVRVANQYGDELPCIVFNEVVAAGSVTGFDVHFLANQDQTSSEVYWIYWGNPSAAVPNYGSKAFKNSFNRTSQFDYSPWYSRRINRGGVETHSTAAAARLITNPPSPADDLFATLNPLGGANLFQYFGLATNSVSVSTNGYISLTPHSQPLNNWGDFVGPNPQGFIAPFWCNLMVNSTAPANAGLFYENLNSGTAATHRALFTWRANRFNSLSEDYIFQVALYRMGDIAFRYDTLNFNALFAPSTSGDNPLNVAPHHTAGISATDGSRWHGITDDSRGIEVSPLNDGSGRNVIHYFQSCTGWTITNPGDPTNITTMAGLTSVGHYDSRIFDGRSTDPTWTNMEYEIAGNGAIDIYVRTSATTAFPAWNAVTHLIGSNLTAGGSVINLTLPNDRYLQYRLVFKKSAVTDNPVLQRIKFNVGYILIDNTTNQFNASNVSQGQTFLASMTYSNFYSNPVNTLVASLTFTGTPTLTWSSITPLPGGLLTGASGTVGYKITADENSGYLNNWIYIDGYVQAGDGLATLTSAAAISRSYFAIRPKAELKIDEVTSPFDKVNKGQGGIPVGVVLRNSSTYVPLIMHGASLTFTLGDYSWSPENTFAPTDQGLFGQYFNTNTANPPLFDSSPAATRLDPTINFFWANGTSPFPPTVNTNYYGMRWSGYVIPEYSEEYTFQYEARGGVRLWINNILVIDSWTWASATRNGNISLTANVPAEIVIEYFKRDNWGSSYLRWSSPSTPLAIIPAARLKPTYKLVLDPGETTITSFTVAVLPTSPSGVAYLNATASGTNGWVPTMETNSSSSTIIDSWVIQAPASLAIGRIQVPELVYRGQANVPVDVEILNIGEADALIASIPLLFTLGSYTDIIAGEPMPVIITGGESRFIKVLVSLLENTPTGTAWIDAEVFGTDKNTVASISAAGAAEPGQWTILAEKILSYKDASHLYPSTVFVRPDAGDIGIFALAENLAPLKEYAIRWYDNSNNEIISATTIGFSDPSGTLAAEWKINSSNDYGVYTVKITNPVNTYSPSQTSFRVVTSASVTASLILPAKVSIGQTFPAYMEIANTGGADATGMVPSALSPTGPGTANLLTGPVPASQEVPGGTIATISYSYTATGQGDFMITANTSGFDASSDAPITTTATDSNVCEIQTPAAVDIVGLVATATSVYRSQIGVEVLMTLQNTGQADANISLADLRSPPNAALSFAASALASPTVPFVLPGNSAATFTFRININAAAPVGPASATARIQYRDANNPITLFTVINQVYTFNIESPTITCYANNTFTTVRNSFNAGATVYARASGLPTNTDVKIRFYESNSPLPPVGIGVGALTPLNSGPTGIVSHPGHEIPIATDKINQWLVIVDDGDDFAIGPNIYAMQFFDVYRMGTFSVALALDKTSCFSGDSVNAAVTVNNLATWTTNLRQRLNSFTPAYAPNSMGTLLRMTAPFATYPFPNGASYTYNVTMKADLDSGLTGSSTLRLPANSWLVYDDANGGAGVYYTSVVDAQNPITIYRKGLRLQTLPLPPALPGLRGEYYNTVSAPPPMPNGLPNVSRIDPTVNFSWAANPDTGITNDYFAVRWSGYVTPDNTATYRFYVRTDDGVRLWVNGVQLVERWINQGPTEVFGDIALTAGVPVPIVMEYFENTGGAVADLRWQSPLVGPFSPAYQIIPSTHLNYIPYVAPVWDFGIVEPGSISVTLQSKLDNTGNHQLDQVKLAKVDLRKSATEIISGSYLQTDPLMPVVVATNSSLLINSTMQIPFHQPPGIYVATMAMFEDHNLSNTLEVTDTVKEPHNLVMARVEVKAVARAMVVNELYDLGVIEPGGTSDEQQLEFVGTGNLPLTDLKFDDMSGHGITIAPLMIGAMAFNGYGVSSISVSIPVASAPGVYYATGTLRDDIPGGAFDEFLVKWAVGTQALEINPPDFALGLGTPTYEIPVFPSTLTNTGELPLNKLRGYSSEFVNISQPGSVATDNINLNSPALIEIADTEAAPTLVYVPGGTATGTYVATFTWFEDISSNQSLDTFEARDQVVASFVVYSFYRLYSLKATEDFGGVKPNTTKIISVGFRNAGSMLIPKVKLVINSLSDGVDTFDAANIASPSFIANVTAGELRYFDLSATVPLLHKHGVFTGLMTIYGDIDDDGIFDAGDEPWCEVNLRIEIGDQEIKITSPVNVLLSGTAASTTPSVFVTAKNTGSLALTRVRAQGTELIPQVPGPSIASNAFQFLPSSLVGSLVINQSRTFSTRVIVPVAQPSGIYDGYIWTWEDANNDSIRQLEETTASVPVQLTVSFVKTLQTSPTSLNLGSAAKGDLATASFIAQNIGNTNLIDARWEKNILTGPTPISAANITITPDPIGFMATPPVGLPVNEVSTLTLMVPTGTADGNYNGTMVFFEDEIAPGLNVYDAGEPFFSLPVTVQIATPFIGVTDPITLPDSNPTGRTASASFTVSNTGSIAFKNLRYSVSNLTSGANTISAGEIIILPASFSALAPGSNQSAEISVNIFPATAVLPGTYSGTFTIYDDRNFSGIREAHETQAVSIISLKVNSYPRLNLIPVTIDAGKIARNTYSPLIPIGFQNVGNVPLNGLNWMADDLFKSPGILVPAASLTWTFSQPEPIAVGALATAQLQIGRISPDQELGGLYGPAEQILHNFPTGPASDSFFLQCEIIPGGPQGLDKGSVWQEVGTATFPVAPAQDTYILSTYVCPGSGSARIGFLLTDEVGIQTGYFGATIDASGILTETNSTGGIADIISQKDAFGDFQNWYRLYIRFSYGHDNLVASKTYMLLQNGGPDGLGHTTWFDGVQLEKAEPNQTGPTSWSNSKKLLSPNMDRDLSGNRGYYQW